MMDAKLRARTDKIIAEATEAQAVIISAIEAHEANEPNISSQSHSRYDLIEIAFAIVTALHRAGFQIRKEQP